MTKPDLQGPRPPSLIPGVVLLVVAALLIVLVLVSNPDSMPGWLRTTIVLVAIAVIVALLGYSAYVFRASTRRGRK